MTMDRTSISGGAREMEHARDRARSPLQVVRVTGASASSVTIEIDGSPVEMDREDVIGDAVEGDSVLLAHNGTAPVIVGRGSAPIPATPTMIAERISFGGELPAGGTAESGILDWPVDVKLASVYATMYAAVASDVVIDIVGIELDAGLFFDTLTIPVGVANAQKEFVHTIAAHPIGGVIVQVATPPTDTRNVVVTFVLADEQDVEPGLDTA